MSDFIYLASQSPRRSQLLQQLGVRHELLLPNAPGDVAEDAEAIEEVLSGEDPQAYVQRVTGLKLDAAVARLARRGLLCDAGAVDTEDEGRGSAIHRRHFRPVDVDKAIVYAHAGERGHQMFDRRHAGAAIDGDTRAHAGVDHMGPQGRDLRSAGEVGPAEADPGPGRGGLQMHAYARAGMKTHTDAIDRRLERALADDPGARMLWLRHSVLRGTSSLMRRLTDMRPSGPAPW
jgi:hypothetical protein